MTRLYLVRHGRTLWNDNGKYQGQSDVELSEEGRLQAELLAERLKGEGIAAFYSSDLCRAKETAAILAKPHGLQVESRPAFRELNFGAWEGLTYAQIEESYGELAARWRENPASLNVPGGESFSTLMERAHSGVEELAERHPEEGVLLVTHGGTIRTIICAALGLDLKLLWRFRQDNAALNILDFYKGTNGKRCILSLFNDTAHLASLPAYPAGKRKN